MTCICSLCGEQIVKGDKTLNEKNGSATGWPRVHAICYKANQRASAPIKCGFCGTDYINNESYRAHLKPNPVSGQYIHLNPNLVDAMFYTGEAWEVVVSERT